MNRRLLLFLFTGLALGSDFTFAQSEPTLQLQFEPCRGAEGVTRTWKGRFPDTR